MKKEQGFTLIELVVVIVILGILAVTAAPKFINLQSDAKTATVMALGGALKSANSLVYTKSIIAGNETQGYAENPTVIIDSAGTLVELNNGYPLAKWENSLENILDINASDDVDDTSEWIYATVVYPNDATMITISLRSAIEPCKIRYNNSNTTITIEVLTEGC
ncbi:MAG: prepilin-type N-terminal cleavage/methylation domain-containing protein [Colwellia sp.]